MHLNRRPRVPMFVRTKYLVQRVDHDCTIEPSVVVGEGRMTTHDLGLAKLESCRSVGCVVWMLCCPALLGMGRC